MKAGLRWAACLAAGALILGACCARFPKEGDSGFTKRLILRMSMEGVVRTGLEGGGAGLPYVYIFALRLSTDPAPATQGPVPVVTPGGNGFVAGNCTHYVLWDPLRSPQYTIWQFRDSSLNDSFQTGAPVSSRLISVGDKTLECEIDLSQLVPASDVDTIQSVQVNLLTMNNTLTTGAGRLWEALGDGRNPGDINRPLLVNLRSSFTYTNANQGDLEPVGDVLDPDLDIRDWSIEVRTN